jgi:hypothetical protein
MILPLRMLKTLFAMVWLTCCFIFLFMLACAPSTSAGSQSHTIRVPLTRFGVSREKNFPTLLFADDGQHILAWWQFGELDSTYPTKFVLFDSTGKLIGQWNETNSLKYLHGFPALEWKWTQKSFLRPPSEKAIEAVAFSSDFSRGCRILVQLLPGSQGAVLGAGLSPVYNLEMWTLSEPKRLLWCTQLPLDGNKCANNPELVGLLNNWTIEPLLIRLNNKWCAEMDPQTGQITRTFTFGPIGTSENAGLEAKQFRGLEDASREFLIASCAFDPMRHLIACGSSENEEIRVLDAFDPIKLMFESHATHNKKNQRRAKWRVPRMEFLAGGRYLITEKQFESRFGPYKHITEIFDSASWQVVWRSSDPGITSVTLSPNAQTIAYLYKATLVIGSFNPRKSDFNSSTVN